MRRRHLTSTQAGLVLDADRCGGGHQGGRTSAAASSATRQEVSSDHLGLADDIGHADQIAEDAAGRRADHVESRLRSARNV